MLALYNFLPLYCPSCGTPTRLDRADNPMAGKDKQRQKLCFVQERHWEIDWDNSYAYADSFTDMDRFDVVGNPVAVHPDEKLLDHARQAGWEIIGETARNSKIYTLIVFNI